MTQAEIRIPERGGGSMGTQHECDALIGDVHIPTGTAMTNGRVISEAGDDSLQEIGKAINNIFSWMYQPIIHDYKTPGNEIHLTAAGELARYKVPVFAACNAPTRRVRCRILASTTAGTCVISATFGGTTVFSQTISGSTDVTTSTTLTGGEVGYLIVKASLNTASDIYVTSISLDWDPCGPNVDDWRSTLRLTSSDEEESLFLPINVDELATKNCAVPVEQVRRMLESLKALWKRRVPLPIITWADSSEPKTWAFSAKTGDQVLLRVVTLQLPLLSRIRVRCWYSSNVDLELRLGPHRGYLPRTRISGDHYLWADAYITVPKLRVGTFVPRDFRMFADSAGAPTVKILSLSAWWEVA